MPGETTNHTTSISRIFQARLELHGPDGVEVVPVIKDSFKIGRRGDNDLQLSGTDVSREHAEIVRTEGRYILYDRGSRYGTFVNNEQVTEKVLSHEDRIRFGRVGQMELTFLLGSEPRVERTSTAVADLRQVATLLQGLRALGSTHVLEEVLALVLESSIELTGAERGFIMLANSAGKLEFKLARSRGRVTLSGTEFETSRRIPEQVFATGQSQLVTDMLDSQLAYGHSGTIALGIRTVLCVALRLRRLGERASVPQMETRIGVLYLDSREKGQLLSSPTRDALETLAREAAVAIENAQLYRESLEKARLEEELRIAAQIQQALLPPRRRVGSFFEAAGAAIPCREIGGDFLDYLDLPGGSMGFALGDVAGKGAPAALLAAVVQGIFTAQLEDAQSPAVTISRMNRALVRRAIESRFATVAYSVLSRDGKLVSCNAGHNPPLIVSRDGTIRRLEKGGLVLGLFERATFEEEELQLQAGDALILFSDGVIETVNPADQEFGEQRVMASVSSATHLTVEELLDKILSDVTAFAGGRPQADDVTVLVTRYLG